MGWKEVDFLTEALSPSPTPLKKKGGSQREDNHLIWNGQIYVLRLLNCSRNGLNKKLQNKNNFRTIKILEYEKENIRCNFCSCHDGGSWI